MGKAKLCAWIGGLVVLTAGCAHRETVVVPLRDPTPPRISFEVRLPNRTQRLDVPSSTPVRDVAPQMRVSADAKVSVRAKAQDDNSGVQTVEIWANYTRYDQRGDIVVAADSMSGRPVTANAKNALVGAIGLRTLEVSHTFDIDSLLGDYRRLEIQVWAKATNNRGGSMQTVVARIETP